MLVRFIECSTHRIVIKYDDKEPDEIFLNATLCRTFLIKSDRTQIQINCEEHSEIVALPQVSWIYLFPSILYTFTRARKRRAKFLPFISLKHGGSITPLFSDYKKAKNILQLSHFGLSPYAANNIRHPSIFKSISPPHDRSRAPSELKYSMNKRRAAIVLHAFFKDALPDILNTISRLHCRPHIIATIAYGPDAAQILKTLREFDRNISLQMVENRGRDILPFINLLNAGAFDEFSYVCKIHTKSSSGSPQNKLLGEAWRRRALLDLLGGQDQLDHVLRMFETNVRLGMIGPASLRLRAAEHKDQASSHCLKIRSQFLARMGLQEVPPTNFFAGSMFWFRPCMLQPLRSLDLTAKQFETEAALGREGVPHALERVLADTVRFSGGTLADCDLAGPE